MNQNYSKENVIMEAVRTILKNDNAVLTTAVKSIHQYCEDRIVRKKAFIQPPGQKMITMEATKRNGDLGLPSSQWYLSVVAIIPMDGSGSPQDEVSDLASRIEFLLNKKPAALNTAVSATKYLRCRLINHLNTLPVDDEAMKIYKRDVVFEMTADDEILNLN